MRQVKRLKIPEQSLLFSRFIISGGLSTSAHWMVLWQLIFHGMEPVIANAIGAFVGAVVNYYLQYYFTYRSKKMHRRALLDYGIVISLSWFANTAIFWTLYEHLNFYVIYSQVSTVILVSLLNYFLYGFKVFNERQPQ